MISARYGSLDQERKWINVTDLVAKELDLDGGLELDVNSGTFGADPNEGAENSLSIRYARCQMWERTPITQLAGSVGRATADARTALREAIAEHQVAVRYFEREEAWIQQFLAAKPPPAAPEVVQIDLFGEKVSATRKTLMLCADSALARQFDAAVWAQEAGGGAATDSDSDEDDVGVIFIEQNAYCFRKIVDQLRLVGMAQPGEPIPPPTIAEHEQKKFDKMVTYYFPGNEAFIKTEGVLRPLGSLQPRGGPKADSEILIKEQEGLVRGWLEQRNPRLELLYRASRDGWEVQQFNARCRNQGPTLMATKTTEGWTFGGYAGVAWKAGNLGYVADPSAVMFALVCHSGLEPTKILSRTPGVGKDALRNHDRNCVCFGGAGDWGANTKETGHCNVGNAFAIPAGQANGNFITGKIGYVAEELEVFRVVE